MSYKKKGKLESSTLETMDEVSSFPFMGIPDRGITKETCEELGIRTKLSTSDGITPVAHFFPVTKKGVLSGYIRRDLKTAKKDAWASVGDVDISCDMLGQSNCSPSGGLKIFIVEGVYDWASVFQTLYNLQQVPKKYKPNVCSVLLGAANAVENIAANKTFVDRYQQVVLGFDSDSATPAQLKKGELKGQDAVAEVARLFPNILNVLFSRKDPSEFLKKKPENNLPQDPRALYSELMFQAKPYEPDDFVEGSVATEQLYAPLKEGIYINTLPKTSAMLHGIRKGEMTVVLAPAGVGKTTVITEVVAPIVSDKHMKVDLIYAEEDIVKAQQRFIALGCNVPLNKFRQNPEIVPLEKREAARKLYVDNKRTAWLDTESAFGKLDPDRLLKRLQWSAAKGYDFALIDHLTMMIYGRNSEVGTIDDLLVSLASHVNSTGQGIIAVSHITRRNNPPPRDKEGNVKYPYWIPVKKEDARGSGAYEQCAWNIICVEPEILESGERGRIRLRVDKNREWSALGITDYVRMNSITGRLEPAEEDYNFD